MRGEEKRHFFVLSLFQFLFFFFDYFSIRFGFVLSMTDSFDEISVVDRADHVNEILIR